MIFQQCRTRSPAGIDMVRSICCMATERYIKQSGRTWWRELSNKLSTIGFHRLESDWGLYTRPKSRKEGLVIILVYVDDFVIAAETKGDIDKLLEKLKTFWKLSEMGEVSTILGMKVTRDRKNRQAFLTQPAYIDRLLERFPKHANYRNWAAPLGKTTVTDGESVALSPYQEIIGCLQWLAGCTRPDISQLQDLFRRLDRGRNERRHVSIRLHERLQAPSQRDEGEDGLRVDLGSFGFSWAPTVLLQTPPNCDCWISLDFLGFSRSNEPFQMGYAAFSLEKNFRTLFRRRGPGTGRQGPWAFRRPRLRIPQA